MAILTITKLWNLLSYLVAGFYIWLEYQKPTIKTDTIVVFDFNNPGWDKVFLWLARLMFMLWALRKAIENGGWLIEKIEQYFKNENTKNNI